MFSYFEKLFPEAIAFVRQRSVSKRLLILLVLLGAPLIATTAYNHRESILSLVRNRVELPIYSILLLTLISTLLAPSFLLCRKLMARRTMVLRFAESWLQYRELMGLLTLEIDAYLLKDEKIFMEEWKKLLPSIKEYHQQGAKLREMLFVIGEVNLAITKNHEWEELKTAYEIFKAKDYQTPFSFLVDLGNPIAATNLHGKEVWTALFISDRFIEYLSYKHKGIKRLKQRQRVVRQPDVATSSRTGCRVHNIRVTDDCLSVDLTDGRTILVPLAWYPRLLRGTSEERSNWRFIGDGEGIHWPELDEDISVENLLLGKRSGESPNSFKKWLDERVAV